MSDQANALRARIIELVKEYHAVAFPPQPFNPGQAPVPVAGRVFDADELVHLVEAGLEFWLTTGRFAAEFEGGFARFFGVRHALLTNSGSSANLLALSCLTSSKLGERRLLPGDEVITVATGFPTTVNPIIQNGLVPVFVDVHVPTYNVDATQLEAARSERTRAVMLAHTLGNPFDLAGVTAFVQRHNLWLIEDCCDALGSTYDGKLAGTFGDLATFSFYPAHHMSCSPDTLIPYLTDDGEFHLEKVENICAKWKPQEIRVASFDRDNKLSYVQPSGIIKHKRRGKQMLRIGLQTGRHVDVTVDHSVFTWDSAALQVTPVEAGKLKQGDFVVIPRRMPRPPGDPVIFIDFLKHCQENDPERFVVRGAAKNNLRNIPQSRLRENCRARKVIPLPYLTDNEGTLRVNKKLGAIHSALPAVIQVTPGLGRFIGFFLAEGSYRQAGITFSFHRDEQEYIDDVLNTAKDVFGIEGFVHYLKESKGANVILDSSTLRIFMEETLEIASGVRNKRLPSVVFQMEEECQGAVLYGLFMGDGSYHDGHLELASVSENLLSDVSYLANMLGHMTSITALTGGGWGEGVRKLRLTRTDIDTEGRITVGERKNKGAPPCGSIIPGSKVLWDGVQRLGMSVNRNYQATSLEAITRHAPEVFDQFSGLKALRDGDLCVLRVAKVENLDVDYEEVYDFSVPGAENFVGGTQPICLHNTMGEGGCVLTDRPALKRLVESFRDWGRDCWCDPGKDNTCGKRFDWQLGELPHGYDHKYTYSHIGYNLKLTDLQAAVGVAQFKKLPEFIAARQRNFRQMYEGLRDLEEFFVLPQATRNSEPSWFGFPLAVRPEAPFTCNQVVAHLKRSKIDTRQIFGGNLTRQPAYSGVPFRKVGDLPNADFVMNRAFWVGVYPGLTPAMIGYMLESIHAFCREAVHA